MTLAERIDKRMDWAQTRDMDEKARIADRKWLDNAEHWGEWVRYSDTEMAEPESIWMLKSKSSPKVRFYATGKGQIGPEHRHMVAATYWAFANRWMDPSVDMGVNLACRAEVLAGGTACPA